MTSKNRQRILECALELFNEHGSMLVSTNHIAGAAQISPGNLYYHFRNKEAIILELMRQMVTLWNSRSQELAQQAPSLSLIEQQLEQVFQTVWSYRFIHRELSPILQAYPSVKSFCVPVLQQRQTEITQIIRLFTQAGIVQCRDDSEIEFIATQLLYIPLFWQNFLDATGQEANRENIQQGIQMMKQLLQPYLSNSAG